MTTQQVLLKLRRALQEVDQTTSHLSDEELLDALADERDWLEAALVEGFSALAISSDVEDTTNYGIVPDPTLQQGTLLALRAAATILNAIYNGKISRGEIGVSWSSGLESESTLQAGKTYREQIDSIQNQADALLYIMRAGLQSTRPQ